MGESQFHLLKTRRFLPLFVTVLLGAANDNVFKNALLILILFTLGREVPMEEAVLVTLACTSKPRKVWKLSTGW